MIGTIEYNPQQLESPDIDELDLLEDSVDVLVLHLEELELRHPDRFVARYSLVMFHRIPYTEAVERGRVQGQILDRLLEGKEELTDVDLQLAARLVDERLPEVSAIP